MSQQQGREQTMLPAGRSPAKLSDVIWSPLAAGTLMLIVGMSGVIAHRPWLFASPGPTAFLQVESPDHPTSHFYNIVVGHLVGLAAGFLAVFLAGGVNDPSVISAHLVTVDRVWAAVPAVAFTTLGSLALQAPHPPAASTTLLIAVGGFKPTGPNPLTALAGVFIIAIAGEALRRIRLRA